jgi:hypothetical protein
MLIRIGRAASEKTMSAVEVVVASAVLLSGLWFISPFYNPEMSTSAQILESELTPRLIGILHIIFAGSVLVAMFVRDWAWRPFVRRWGAFGIFVLYMFYGFSGILMLGLGRVSWISTFAVALIAALIHIKLRWELLESARD